MTQAKNTPVEPVFSISGFLYEVLSAAAFVVALIMLMLTITSCASEQPVDKSVTIANPLDCAKAAPIDQLTCTRGLLPKLQEIVNDPGTVKSIKEVETKGRCSRYDLLVEHGAKNPPNERKQESHEFSVCSGSLWNYLVSHVEAMGAGAVLLLAAEGAVYYSHPSGWIALGAKTLIVKLTLILK